MERHECCMPGEEDQTGRCGGRAWWESDAGKLLVGLAAGSVLGRGTKLSDRLARRGRVLSTTWECRNCALFCPVCGAGSVQAACCIWAASWLQNKVH